MDPEILTKLSPREQQVITEFRRRLTVALGNAVHALRLFGSRARGESHEDSDLDILVLVSSLTPPVKHTIWDIANDLFLETDVYLSPLVMSVDGFQQLRARERRLALDIDREGIPI